MKHSELTFQTIVESSPNAIVLVNEEGKIAYTNHQTEKLFGYSKAELTGRYVEMLIPERYTSNHSGFRKSFFTSPHVRSMGEGRELYAKRKDSSEFPIEIGLNPIVTPRGTMVLASVIDITERKRAEARFRLVVELAPNAMVLINRGGIITLVNKQTEVLFGYERGALVGAKLELLLPDRFATSHVLHRDGYFRSPQTRAMGVGRDLYGRRKDGSEVQIEIGLNPIETEEGQLVLASIIDITERKQQELALKKQVELEIRNKELEQFAFIASHDLQEPLRTISNYMQIFQEDYSDLLDVTAKQYLMSVHRATKRMSMLVNELLNFSRLGRDKRLVFADCNKLVQQVIEDVGGLIKRSGAIVEVTDLPLIYVYEVEISQVFQNLIVNAIKFQAQNNTPRIRITSQQSDGVWQFAVSDNGIGVSSIHYDRIFEIFQRVHIQADYEGNGVGLANCKKIIEMHQGEIWLESTLGKGTTFYFTIPILKV